MVKEEGDEEGSSKNGKKIFLFVLIVLLIIILSLFGTQIYLFINNLLGNDLIIRLSVDNNNLFLSNSQTRDIEFKISGVTNPFCDNNCNFIFKDLSDNSTIDTGNASIKPAISFSKSYTLTAPKKGTGQKLYRFEVECKSTKTYLCKTNGELERTSQLITFNYDLNMTQQLIKNSSKEDITSMLNYINYVSLNLEEIDKSILSLNSTTNTTLLQEKKTNISTNIINLNESLSNLKQLWEKPEYLELAQELNKTEKNFDKLSLRFKNLNQSLFEDIYKYNLLIDNLTTIKSKIQGLKTTTVSSATALEVNNTIKDFNNVSILFIEKNDLIYKGGLVSTLFDEIDRIEELVKQDLSSGLILDSSADAKISEINLTKLNFSNFGGNPTEIIIEFNEPSPECCLFNICKPCCKNSCSNEKIKYPVIFLHGHDFSRGVSAELSLNVFTGIQQKLEEEGYLNAGALLPIYEDERIQGIYGKTNSPVTFRASYYFDLFRDTGKSSIIQTKTDNIDTYAIRLRDIINTVKYETNRDKVIIVTHSMGGLVARRYIQVFGDDNVEKLIMVGSPNHGVSGNVLNYCSLFGAKAECSDMDKSSLFINKLENSKTPKIAVYNIIGIDCDTNNENGDGIVTNSSAYLDFAKNSYVSGTCDTIGLKVLHTDILDLNKYPEVYNLVNQSIMDGLLPIPLNETINVSG